MDDLAHTFHAPQPPAHYYNPAPMPEATHSSNSSLTSMSSLTSCPPTQNVFSSSTTDGEDSIYTLSRHSSMASLDSLYRVHAPPDLNTSYSTPGKMGPMRSSSRVTPYNGTNDRHGHHGRSASISSVVSSGIQQYWSSPSAVLENGINKMSLGQPQPMRSLHHRRTSSRNSANYPSLPSSTHTHSKSLSSPRTANRIKQSVSMSTLHHAGGRDSLLGDIRIPQAIPTTERSAYVQQTLMDRARLVNSTSNIAQQDKARSQWVRQWLRLSYTPSKNVTVPRQGLFASYEQSCMEYGVKPINAASFGKAVRAAYPKIKTRRLGKRGNSKYHYIDLAPSVPVEAQRLNEYDNSRG